MEKEKSGAPFGRIGQIIGIVILLFLVFKMCGGPTKELRIAEVRIEPSVQYQPSNQQTPQKSEESKTESEKVVQTKSEGPYIGPLSNAAYADIYIAERNWDSDADIDGPMIFLVFNDDSGNEIQFTNTPIQLSIEIYAKDPADLKPKKGRLIYKGISTMTASSQGDIFKPNGIRIPYEDIETVETDSQNGIVVVTARLPDGREISSMNEFLPVKPD